MMLYQNRNVSISRINSFYIVQVFIESSVGGDRRRSELFKLSLLRTVVMSQLVKLMLSEPLLPVVNCRSSVTWSTKHPHLGELSRLLSLSVVQILILLLLLLPQRPVNVKC